MFPAVYIIMIVRFVNWYIFFSGQNSKRFYRIANLSKKLKFNFAMLFLADEAYKSRGKKFEVRIGKPIDWQHFDNSRTTSIPNPH